MPLSSLQWSSLATCYPFGWEQDAYWGAYEEGNILSGIPCEWGSPEEFTVNTFFPNQSQLGLEGLGLGCGLLGFWGGCGFFFLYASSSFLALKFVIIARTYPVFSLGWDESRGLDVEQWQDTALKPSSLCFLQGSACL